MRFHLSRNSIALGIISILIVIYAEWIYPAKAFDQCVWPLGPTAKHVALIADPQVVDLNTYPGRPGLLMRITEIFTDRYMARNFRLLHQKLRPDAIFFLGDLFDGGREWQDKEWNAEYERFMKIFPASKKTEHFMHLPGNHDVGSANDIVQYTYDRFKRFFGNPNQVRTIGDHSIVTLDTNALMNENLESVYRPTTDFFNKLKANQGDYDPIVVLSHVPLYRPKGSYCGFEREGKPLEWQKGHQYITEVGPELSQDILYGLKPVYLFSGDDHDACKYNHRWSITDSTEEYTIKTFSMAMGVKRPGLQLLSLDSRKRQGTDSCLLGKPFYPIFIQLEAYGFVVIAYALFLTRLRPRNYRRLPVSNKKEKPISENNRRFSREFANGILAMFATWVVAQLFINWWSYGKLA